MELYTLEELLKNFTVKDLKVGIKNFGIKGCSKLKKEELIEKLIDYVSDSKNMEEEFLIMENNELEILEGLFAGKEIEPEQMMNVRYLINRMMLFSAPQKQALVSAIEIKDVYQKVKESDSYQEKRKKIGMLDFCLKAAVNLYGAIPIPKLEAFLNQYGIGITQEEMIAWCTLRTDIRGFGGYFIKEGYLLAEYLGVDAYSKLLKAQEGKPFYQPSKEEFFKYADNYYMERNSYFSTVFQHIVKKIGIPKDAAYGIAEEFQLQMHLGDTPKELLQRCRETGINFKTQNEVATFYRILTDLYNNTRMHVNCGHTPMEMLKIQGKEEEFFAQTKKKEVFPVNQPTTSTTAKKTPEKMGRVYPNDPCPCGSGRKYKKCCGKR